MENILNEKEVSKLLGISIHTLRRWRADRKNLRFVRMGGRVAYTESEIEGFIKANTVKTKPRSLNFLISPKGGQKL